MFSFREQRPGKYYALKPDGMPRFVDQRPPFVRFAAEIGYGAPLDVTNGPSPVGLLRAASLAWKVERTRALVQTPDGQTIATPHHWALVRPDTGQVMSVVTSAYAHAENLAVLEAGKHLAAREGDGVALAAASFGRDAEHTLFAFRAKPTDRGDVRCVLVRNSHGTDGAVRFEIIDVDPHSGVVYSGFDGAAHSVPHVGDMEERLESASHYHPWFVEALKRLDDSWRQLENTLWTPVRARALIEHLWGQTPDLEAKDAKGRLVAPEEAYRHPAFHLDLDRLPDADAAFRRVCTFLDNESEACEPGDFTPDRNERLALGAGAKLKRKAWEWITSNTL